MPTPDVITALRALLLADSAVSGLVGTRVFRVSLPAAEAQLMPRSAVVLARAGGRNDRGYLPVARHRVDVRAYGVNPAQSYAVWAAVHDAFKNLRPRVVGNCRILALKPEGGLADTVEPEVEWPLIWSSYLVEYSEAAIAA